MKKMFVAPIALIGLAVLTPATRAESYLTPYAGVAFSGKTDDSKLTFGGDLAFAGHGLLGASIDFGYTKDFFGNNAPIGDNNVTTLMGNVMLISPGHPRIYASGGVGLMKTRVKDTAGFFDIGSSDFGFNVGGGIYVVGHSPLGFRADIRYFRTLTDPQPDGEFDVDLGNLDYWRATAGITLKF
jgi:Outer membrane protein beta-barrel domain